MKNYLPLFAVAAAHRAVRLNARRNLALRDELQTLVDGQGDGGAGPPLACQLLVDAAMVRVGQQPRLASLAAKLPVERLLDTGVAKLCEIDATQDVRRQRTLGIVAVTLGLDVDPIQVQASEVLGLLRRDVALHPREADRKSVV